MATYSYSKAQLDKRNSPVTPLSKVKKIAAIAGVSGIVFLVLCVALAPDQPAPVAVAPAVPVVVTQPAPASTTETVVTEPVNDMPEACVKAKVTREECDQAIALYNAQQNQGPTWSGQEFNENQRKAWAK
jgi:hypothetical protein